MLSSHNRECASVRHGVDIKKQNEIGKSTEQCHYSRFHLAKKQTSRSNDAIFRSDLQELPLARPHTVHWGSSGRTFSVAGRTSQIEKHGYLVRFLKPNKASDRSRLLRGSRSPSLEFLWATVRLESSHYLFLFQGNNGSKESAPDAWRSQSSFSGLIASCKLVCNHPNRF